jgi:hypothetical protein
MKMRGVEAVSMLLLLLQPSQKSFFFLISFPSQAAKSDFLTPFNYAWHPG